MKNNEFPNADSCSIMIVRKLIFVPVIKPLIGRLGGSDSGILLLHISTPLGIVGNE